MTFTFSSTSIATDLAKVRARIGDCVDLTSESESLTDEEIAYALSECNNNIARTSVFALELLIAKLRLKVTRNVSGINSSVREKIENAESLRDMLLERTKTNEKSAYYGGSSVSRDDTASADTDFRKPSFEIGRDDHSGVGINDSDDEETT